MKRMFKSETVILSIASLAIMLAAVACAPSNSTVLVDTPELTPTLAAPASPSPIPTVEPTPEPRIISFDMNQSLKDDNTGGEIIFQNLTYTQDQDMELTFTVSNPVDYPIVLVYPIYATINGYGFSFAGTEQYDFAYTVNPNSESKLVLTAKLDSTMDRIMSIEEIKTVQFNCVFAGRMGEPSQTISDEIINPNCPKAYVQSYNLSGDDVSILMEPEYYTTGINNDIKIKSTYDDIDKKIYLTLIGTSIYEDSIIGQVADFGKAHLAIDGVVVPTDDDIYTPNGEVIYLPNNGYCVISFDVSKIPGFNYQKSSLACSFDMSYSPSIIPYGLFSGVLQTDSSEELGFTEEYDEQGEIWIDNEVCKFIFNGIGYDDDENFFLDGYLVNKTESNTIVAYIEIYASGMGILEISDPVPASCSMKVHFARYFYSPLALGDKKIKIDVDVLGTGGKVLGNVAKTITLGE